MGAVVEILEDFPEEAAVSVTCADVGLEAGPQHGLYQAAHFLVCGGQARARRGEQRLKNLLWILKTQMSACLVLVYRNFLSNNPPRLTNIVLEKIKIARLKVPSHRKMQTN
jgi:hypothetical protein